VIENVGVVQKMDKAAKPIGRKRIIQKENPAHVVIVARCDKSLCFSFACTASMNRIRELVKHYFSTILYVVDYGGDKFVLPLWRNIRPFHSRYAVRFERSKTLSNGKSFTVFSTYGCEEIELRHLTPS
jgi:hypothetical protein